MNMSVIPTADVAAFVAAVRDELADLPAEEVEDLTSGMEADLSELASEAPGDVSARLGTPAAYAAELRAAAGLPPAGGPQKQGLRATLTQRAERWRAEHPSVVATAEELRPAWWLARGGLIGLVPFAMGRRGIGLFIFMACVAGSLWLGLRNRRAEQAGQRRSAWSGLAVTLTVVAVIAAPGTLSMLGDAASAFRDVGENVTAYAPASSIGLAMDGSAVSQVYAYDVNGQRLDNVRLFNEFGTPLRLGPDGVDQDGWLDSAGRTWTNVFPGRMPEGAGWSVNSPGLWQPPAAIDALVKNIGPGGGVWTTSGEGSQSPDNPQAPGPAATLTPSASATSPAQAPSDSPSASTSPTAAAPPAPSATTPAPSATTPAPSATTSVTP